MKLGLQKPPSPVAATGLRKVISPAKKVGERNLTRDPVGVVQ